MAGGACGLILAMPCKHADVCTTDAHADTPPMGPRPRVAGQQWSTSQPERRTVMTVTLLTFQELMSALKDVAFQNMPCAAARASRCVPRKLARTAPPHTCAPPQGGECPVVYRYIKYRSTGRALTTTSHLWRAGGAEGRIAGSKCSTRRFDTAKGAAPNQPQSK